MKKLYGLLLIFLLILGVVYSAYSRTSTLAVGVTDGGDPSGQGTLAWFCEKYTTEEITLVLSGVTYPIKTSLTVPSNIYLRVMPGSMFNIDSGVTLSLNPANITANPNQKIFSGSGKVYFYKGGDIVAGWFADANDTNVSTELQAMIDSAPKTATRFLFLSGVSSYGISSALTLPQPESSKARFDWTFEGIGGKAKFLALDSVDIFNTYSLDQKPTYWTRGLTFKNLWLDGNKTGTNGFNLHGVALNLKIEDSGVTAFTNAGILLSRCLETQLNNIYSEGNKYNLYLVDGTTITVNGGSYRYGEVGFHADGNLTETLADVNSGPYDVLVLGGVFEANKDYGIHITAGGRYKFIKSHVESIGYNTSSVSPYAVKIDNDGGEGVRGVSFDHCVFSTESGVSLFHIEDCQDVEFIRCQDSGLKGGVIASTAETTIIHSGLYENDFRLISKSGITNQSSSTIAMQFETDGFKFANTEYDYIEFYQNKLINIIRENLGNNVFQSRLYSDGDHRLIIDVEGTLNFGGGTNPTDVTLSRATANILTLGNGDGLGVGNTIINTNAPAGATARAWPIFNASGVTLGFVPIYGTEW